MKIYLSSTFEDLEDFRDRVYRQLRKMRHDVVSMEDYVATDGRPLDECLDDVAACDAYIGLFAWRYGYVPDRDNPDRQSITELEYRHAAELGKPRLVFLLDEDAAWRPSLMDTHTGDNESGVRVARLREELATDNIVSWFSTPDQLASDVGAAIHRLIESNRKQEKSKRPDDRPQLLVERSTELDTYTPETIDLLEHHIRESLVSAGEFPEDPWWTEMIGALARRGALLRRRLLDGRAPDLTATMAVTATAPSPWRTPFPIELLYAWEPPAETAVLCPNAVEALQTGYCRLHHTQSETAAHVCPIGFWGLGRVVHRLPPDQALEQAGHEMSLGATESLPFRASLSLENIVLAASERVDTDRLQRSVRFLQGIAGTVVTVVESWSDWRQAVQDVSPTLLVVLPNRETSSATGLHAWEIGGSLLESGMLHAQDVVGRVEDRQPLVVAVGYGTATATGGVLSLTREFLMGGASAAVGTQTLVTVEDAVSIVEATVRGLIITSRTGTATPLGQVLSGARRALLLGGSAAAFSVIGVDDAGFYSRPV